MSEEQLIVTIGAKDSASTIIGKVNSQLKYLDKEYNLAMKSSEGFDKSMDGLGTKLKSLQSKYEANGIKLKAYKDQFDKAKESVSKKEAELRRLTQAEGDNSAAIAKAEEQISKYKTQMGNAAKNINLTELEMKNLDRQIKTTSNSINTFKVDQFKKQMEEMATKMNTYGDRLKTFGAGMTTAGTGLMRISAPIIALGAASVKAAIDFETAFAGVRKTVNGTEEDFAKLEKGIKDMSQRMPQSASQIAAVAEAAGQLGVKTENILEFTKTMVMLGDSTNMSSTDAATALARLANITQMPQDKFQNLGSVIVELGNNMATTESEITEMGLRLAGAGKQVGLSEAQTLGLAAALSSVGVEAEAGGSAFSKVMVSMQLAAETGTKANEVIAQTGLSLRELELMSSLDGDSFKGVASSLSLTTGELKNLMSASSDLEAFAKVTGKTAEEFKKGFKEDAAGSIVSFITALQTCESQGISAIAVLDGMGITEVRLRDSLLRAAGAGDVFSSAIQMGTEAWESNTALTTEAGKRYETTASKIAMLKNRATELGIKIGEDLMPYIVDIMEGLSNLINWFSGLDKSTQQAIIKTGMMTFALGGLMRMFGPLVSGMGSTLKVGANIVKWLATTQKASTGASLALQGVGATATATAGSSSILATGFGGVATGLGSVVVAALPVAIGIAAVGTAIYAAHEQTELLNTSLSATAEELPFLQSVWNDYYGGVIKTKEEQTKLGLIYEDWNKNISEDTITQLEAVAESSRNLQNRLKEFNFTGNILTGSEKDTIVAGLEKFFDGIIEKVNERSPKVKTALNEAFMADNTIDESEQKILTYIDSTGEKALAKLNENEAKAKQIMENGYSLRGFLTEQEIADINSLIEEGNNLALKNIVKSDQEYLEARANFLVRSKNMNREDISAELQTKSEARDTEVAADTEFYDTKIEMLKMMSREADTETQKSIDIQIEKLNKEKADKLKIREDEFKEYLGVIKENYPEIYNTIDWHTGKILEAEQQLTRDSVDDMKEKYANMNTITQTGYFAMTDKDGKYYNDLYVVVDETTGEISGIWNQTTGDIEASTDEIRLKLMDMATEHSKTKEQVKTDVSEMIYANSTFSEATKTSSLGVISALTDIQKQEDGTYLGMMKINGTAVQVTVNKDGTINDLNTIINKMNEVPNEKWVTLKVRTQVERQINALEDGLNPFVPGGYASGTSNATRGVHLVGEDGPELMYFNGGETVIPADKTKNLITSGGYFNPTSQESRSLSNTINNYSNTNYSGSNSNSGIDGAALASQIANAVASAITKLSINMNSQKVASIVDTANGNTGTIQRRQEGW